MGRRAVRKRAAELGGGRLVCLAPAAIENSATREALDLRMELKLEPGSLLRGKGIGRLSELIDRLFRGGASVPRILSELAHQYPEVANDQDWIRRRLCSSGVVNHVDLDRDASVKIGTAAPNVSYTKLNWEWGTEDGIEIDRLNPGRIRLLCTSFGDTGGECAAFGFGDVLTGRFDGVGDFTVRGVGARSRLIRRDLVVSREFLNDPDVRDGLKRIAWFGGYYEIIFGGVLAMNLHPEVPNCEYGKLFSGLCSPGSVPTSDCD